MACPNYWDSPFRVGSHHLARGFIRDGWRVAYISDPISPFHWLSDHSDELRERFRNYRTGGVSQLDGRLWAYVPAALLTPHNKPLLRTNWVSRHWPLISWPNVVTMACSKGFGDVDLLYLDSVAQRFWVDKLEARRSVYRVADRSSGFLKSTRATLDAERELAQSVSLVVYTAHSLQSHVESLGPKKVLHLPNGVDLDHFVNGDRSMPRELVGVRRPIAIYVGALDVWFDYDLINFATRRLPDVSFVLIGPDDLARRQLEHRPNLHLLGRRPYERLPGYLYNADVGLIPFDTRGHPGLVNGIHPLKLYEYMACGLPVVAVEWEELTYLRSPALLTRDANGFVEAVEAAVARPPDRERLVRFASSADWRDRVTKLLAALYS